jgi:hypothetical protein
MANEDDHDRTAILARRQRFIAIALSSLAAACANKPSQPQPCLSPPMPLTEGESETDTPPAEDPPAEDPTAEDPPVERPPAEDPTEAPPQPCLKVMAPR